MSRQRKRRPQRPPQSPPAGKTLHPEAIHVLKELRAYVAEEVRILKEFEPTYYTAQLIIYKRLDQEILHLMQYGKRRRLGYWPKENTNNAKR